MNDLKIGDEVWINGLYCKGYGIVINPSLAAHEDLVKIQPVYLYGENCSNPFMIAKNKVTLKTI